MYEVEVKAPVDYDRVRERLEALDADHLGSVRQVDTYYGAPHRDFAETDEALRLRREDRADGTVHVLTYKGPRVDEISKTRAEHETVVGDPDATDDVLRALGFEPAATVGKDRERFALEGFTVSLDAVDGVGTFVEVEQQVATEEATVAEPGSDDEEAVAEARDEAVDLLAALGVDPEASVRTSYLAMRLAEES